ncbi:YIP1 family protein [Limibaculum sp. FT325]|uniref:YIP1 family protein n=1 Tax=Thermohalobaculum sediminis TaxID=2939436 RepID=UPI0020BDF4B4|nr:YIP1 family protein [Limibaculum sediminis]MCL5775893.1 YIP1 family protein [Limibaculum sediminis]
MAIGERRLDGTFVSDLPDVRLSDIRGDEDSFQGMSLWARMKLSYIDMRAATRQLIGENPSEARLLFFVLLSDVIFFLNRGVSLVISPGSGASEKLPLEIGLWLVAALFLRTLTLYLFSGAIAFACRMCGGEGSWRDTRTGVFWASLVAAPIGVIGALIVALFAHLEPYAPILAEPAITLPAHLIGMVFFVFFVSASVAEAHRFRNTSPVFIAFSLLTVALLVLGIYVYANYGR